MAMSNGQWAMARAAKGKEGGFKIWWYPLMLEMARVGTHKHTHTHDFPRRTDTTGLLLRRHRLPTITPMCIYFRIYLQLCACVCNGDLFWELVSFIVLTLSLPSLSRCLLASSAARERVVF